MLLDIIGWVTGASTCSADDHVCGVGDRPCKRSAWCETYCSRYIFKVISAQVIIMLLLLQILLLLLLLPARRLIIRERHRVQNVHAHRAFLLNDEPLIDAIVMKVVIAWLQHFHQLLVRYDIEANCAIVYLDL